MGKFILNVIWTLLNVFGFIDCLVLLSRTKSGSTDELISIICLSIFTVCFILSVTFLILNILTKKRDDEKIRY